jgi:hypothetical protein
VIDSAMERLPRVAMHEWVAEPCAFKVLAGASSRDIRLKGAFELTQ